MITLSSFLLKTRALSARRGVVVKEKAIKLTWIKTEHKTTVNKKKQSKTVSFSN